MFLSLNKKRKQVSKSRMKQNQISCLYSVGPVKHKHKCKQYKIHLEFLEKEKNKASDDYNFISDQCYKLLEQLSFFITDDEGKVLPDRKEIALQVIRAARFGVIKGEGLKQKK